VVTTLKEEVLNNPDLQALAKLAGIPFLFSSIAGGAIILQSVAEPIVNKTRDWIRRNDVKADELDEPTSLALPNLAGIALPDLSS
jgi:hypothetical protein